MRFFGQACHIGWIASCQQRRTRLPERDGRQQGIDGVAVTGHAGGAEKFACLAAKILVNRRNDYVAKNPVDAGVLRAAAQYLRQGGSRGYDEAALPLSIGRQRADGWVTSGELGEALRVEYQRPGCYSSS